MRFDVAVARLARLPHEPRTSVDGFHSLDHPNLAAPSMALVRGNESAPTRPPVVALSPAAPCRGDVTSGQTASAPAMQGHAQRTVTPWAGLELHVAVCASCMRLNMRACAWIRERTSGDDGAQPLTSWCGVSRWPTFRLISRVGTCNTWLGSSHVTANERCE